MNPKIQNIYTPLLCLGLLLGLFFSVPAWGEKRNISFRHLTTDDGLSQFSVNALYQDERGFIWIGTREGLNLYDNHGIRTFKHEKDNPNSLYNNTVLRISGDRQGKVYLICSEGLVEFNLRKEEFRLINKGNYSAIYFQDSLYVAHQEKIEVLNPQTGELREKHSLEGRIHGYITFLQHDSRGSLWIGSDKDGLWELTPEKEYKNAIKDANIASIYEDSQRRLWVGTWDRGLYVRTEEGQWTNLRMKDGLCSDFIRCFVEDNLGQIWAGSYRGLNCINPSTRKIQHYKADAERGSLTHSSIWSLMKDQQGTIWVGTYFGGVNYFNPEYEIYTHYREANGQRKGLSSSIIGKIIEDKSHNLWICTEGGGVNVLNRTTGETHWYQHSPNQQNSISQNNVKAICEDEKRGVMWIGTHLGGLNKLDLRTNRFTHYRAKEGDEKSLPSDIVRDIILKDDDLVVATQKGVCLFHPQTETSELLFQQSEQGRAIKEVAALCLDRTGKLWISAKGVGLYTYDFTSQTLKRYTHEEDTFRSLSSNIINSIVEDKEGRIWLATSGAGLDLYRPETDDFQNFDSKSAGLSSDCIYDIRDSGKGKLYVLTNSGFSIFDTQTQLFENHNRENGFPLTAFNENAICLSHDGEVFLGSPHGMISFHPEDLNFQRKPYSILPVNLRVDGETVHVGDQTSILEQSLSYTDKIRIRSKYSTFTVEFTTTNFLAENNEKILYRLDGFSDTWTSARNLHEITYTNLNPGDYTLILKGEKKEGQITPIARLKIEVLPPFYASGWAFLLYAILIGGILWVLLNMYHARIRLQESLRYEKKRTHDIEEMNRMKTQFFTNISHEFRTPLTLIMGQIEMLLQVQTFTPTIYNKVLRIYKNCNQLKDLIGELLDFRKHELGHMKIHVSEHDMIHFLNENYLIFDEYAQFQGIELSFERTEEHLLMWFDPQQIQKVVNNLLSNALKHTPKGGHITLWVTSNKEEVRFGVSDTGEGISKEDIRLIFDRFYQAATSSSNKNRGTGIGLALTKAIIELHHGSIEVESEQRVKTTLSVRLPRLKSAFREEEIDKRAKEEIIASNDTPTQWVESGLKEEKQEQDDDIYRRIHGAKILIIEDNDSLREMLKNIFQPIYEVHTAKDGQEGWEKVQSEEPQIVLSDVMMPRMSGTELCRKIKEDINTCHIPVVLLTARTSAEHTIEGLKTGADDYITKPFNTVMLVSRCNNLVNSRIVLKEKFGRHPEQSPQMLATNAKDQDLIDRATKIITEHLDDPEFNIMIFSREMGMARTNLFSKFKAITGTTPNEFIQTIRLKKAANLLNDYPDWSISDIADRTGFSSAHYFSKCFKAQFKLSPLAYRKSIGQEGASEGTTPKAPSSSEEKTDIQDEIKE